MGPAITQVKSSTRMPSRARPIGSPVVGSGSTGTTSVDLAVVFAQAAGGRPRRRSGAAGATAQGPAPGPCEPTPPRQR